MAFVRAHQDIPLAGHTPGERRLFSIFSSPIPKVGSAQICADRQD